MHRLALLAVLLVAVMPSVNRWLNAESGSASATLSLAMCTSDGMSWVKQASLQLTDAQAPQPGETLLSEHCGYCVLLASLLPLMLALALVFFVQRRVVFSRYRLLIARPPVWLRGLRARGPPCFL